MGFQLTQVLSWLIQYKYLVLFPIIVIEGPLATVIAGFVSSLGHMNFLIAYIVVTFGDTAGDIIYYAIGRFGRENFIKRWGKYIGIPPERVIHIEKHFERHGGKTLLIGKLTHGIGAIFLVTAGLVKMPFYKFVGANFGATLIKSLALLMIGFYFGHAIIKINSILEFISAISISIGILAILIYFRYYNKKTKDKSYE